MNRRSVTSYALFWAVGAAFAWWPWILVRLLFERRPRRVAPAALVGVCLCLTVSLLFAAAFSPPPGRVLGALANLAVWVTVLGLIRRKWTSAEVEGLAKGIIDLALIQAVLVLLAQLAYPTWGNSPLPLSYLLPESLRSDPSLAASTSTRLAFLDYFGQPVVRTSGIFGYPTWAGAVAALGCVLLLFGPAVPGWAGRTRLRRAVLATLIASTVFFSYSRVDAVALVAVSLMIVAMRARSRLPPWAWAASLCVLMGCTIVGVSFVSIGDAASTVNSRRVGSLESRVAIYEPTIRAIARAPTPLIGAGVKSRQSGLLASVGSHSSYLGLAYRGGIVAAILFVVFLLQVLVRAIRAKAEVAVGLTLFVLIWCLNEDFDTGHLVPLALPLASELARLNRDSSARANQAGARGSEVGASV